MASNASLCVRVTQGRGGGGGWKRQKKSIHSLSREAAERPLRQNQWYRLQACIDSVWYIYSCQITILAANRKGNQLETTVVDKLEREKNEPPFCRQSGSHQVRRLHTYSKLAFRRTCCRRTSSLESLRTCLPKQNVELFWGNSFRKYVKSPIWQERTG